MDNNSAIMFLQLQDLLQLFLGVVGRRDRVADRAVVAEDLVVVAARAGLIPEEVDHVKLFILNELQAVGLVPAAGKGVYRDLAALGEAQPVLAKLGVQSRLQLGPEKKERFISLIQTNVDKRKHPPDIVFLVKLGELVPLLL